MWLRRGVGKGLGGWGNELAIRARFRTFQHILTGLQIDEDVAYGARARNITDILYLWLPGVMKMVVSECVMYAADAELPQPDVCISGTSL